MSDFLQAALSYAKHGWHVFPCNPGKKTPATQHGVYDATTDERQIRAWWTANPNYNIAVACGEKSGITVVDIDDNCEEWLEKLPKTLTQKTPSGGYHALYNYCPDCRNSVRLRPGLDVRNNGGYVLLAPSRLADCGSYEWASTWNDDLGPKTLANFPKCLILPENQNEPNNISQPVPADTLILERARLYLAECDPAIQGCGGHNKLLYAAGRMVNGFLLTNEQAYDILAREFNPRCIPPWNLEDQKDERDFRRKITEARKNPGQHEPGWLLGQPSEIPRGVQGIFEKCIEKRRSDNHNQEQPSGFISLHRGHDTRPADAALVHLCNPPGLLGEICQWMNETALIPQPLLSLAASLTFLGTLLGQKAQDGLGSRSNLYCMGVAPSSAGKNHAITSIRNLCAEALCTDLLGGEYVASDAAIEERMAKCPVTLFLWDEIGYLLSHIRSGLSKNHAQVVATLMRLYSSANSIYLGREYADKDRQRVIIQPSCSIYGTATPESFANGLSPDQLQDGWLSRCLVFYSNARPDKQRNMVTNGAIPTSIVEQVKQWYNWHPEIMDSSELVKALPNNGTYPKPPPKPIIIPETPEATEIFTAFDYETIRHGNDYPQLACLWKKGEENARRIGLICACSAEFTNPVISEYVATYACSLVRYLLESFEKNIVPEIVGNEIERRKQKIIRLVGETKNKGITRQELTKHTRWTTARDRATLLDDLMQSGEITFTFEDSTFKLSKY